MTFESIPITVYQGVKMAEKIKFEVEGYECQRCFHRWRSRSGHVPRVCPACHSYLFDVPKEEKKNEQQNVRGAT